MFPAAGCTGWLAHAAGAAAPAKLPDTRAPAVCFDQARSGDLQMRCSLCMAAATGRAPAASLRTDTGSLHAPYKIAEGRARFSARVQVPSCLQIWSSRHTSASSVTEGSNRFIAALATMSDVTAAPGRCVSTRCWLVPVVLVASLPIGMQSQTAAGRPHLPDEPKKNVCVVSMDKQGVTTYVCHELRRFSWHNVASAPLDSQIGEM